jgi:hypothetical protein
LPIRCGERDVAQREPGHADLEGVRKRTMEIVPVVGIEEGSIPVPAGMVRIKDFHFSDSSLIKELNS